jgi:hypothetical protein
MRRKAKVSASFSVEKKQKDFSYSGPSALKNPGSSVKKVFCAAFVQKSGFLASMLTAARWSRYR